jgi:hypothetical protein
MRHQVHCDQETVEERMSRVLIYKKSHQLNITNETQEEANDRHHYKSHRSGLPRTHRRACKQIFQT